MKTSESKEIILFMNYFFTNEGFTNRSTITFAILNIARILKSLIPEFLPNFVQIFGDLFPCKKP